MKIKRCLCAFVVCCMFFTSVVFAAGSVSKTIKVSYQGIKLNINGATVTPRDANGAVVEPFIYNGTTYLPVRAVGNALGQQVSWDGNSKTVYIGSNLGQSNFLMDVCPPYETNYGYYQANGDIKDGTNHFLMAGETYSNGFKVGFCSETVGTDVLFFLGGKYRTLSFDLGQIDGKSGLPLALKIYKDGILAEIIEMDREELPKSIIIDLNYANQLKIEARSSGGDGMWGTEYGIANAILS